MELAYYLATWEKSIIMIIEFTCILKLVLLLMRFLKDRECVQMFV